MQNKLLQITDNEDLTVNIVLFIIYSSLSKQTFCQ